MTKTPRIPHASDRALRRLFAHPEVVADLLRGFAPSPAVRGFNRASLRPLPDHRVDSKYNRRESDASWGFSLASGAEVALIFEAQSSADRAMAGRITAQLGMFFEHLQRTRPGEPLPGVLPVVFHTGGAPWRAQRSLAGNAAREAGLLNYLADSCYLLLEVGALAAAPLPEANLVSVVVRMEAACGASELIGVLESEKAFLLRRGAGLWREYFVWAREVLAPLKMPDADLDGFESLKEGMDMIAERILEEIEEHREEGRVEGRIEGRVEERARGLENQRGLLRGQIVRKFGDKTAEEWSRRLPTLDDDERLLELGGLIIDCETGEEFLNRL